MTTRKNTFGGMGIKDDFSDDEAPKMQVKKSVNKKLEGAAKQGGAREAAPRHQKMNANQAVADGFEIAGE